MEREHDSFAGMIQIKFDRMISAPKPYAHHHISPLSPWLAKSRLDVAECQAIGHRLHASHCTLP